MIKNIIFDVDGTLLDSKRDIAGAQLWVLQQLGIENYTEEDLYPHIGKTLQETFTLLLPDRLHPKIPEAAIMYRDYYPSARPREHQTIPRRERDDRDSPHQENQPGNGDDQIERDDKEDIDIFWDRRIFFPAAGNRRHAAQTESVNSQQDNERTTLGE